MSAVAGDPEHFVRWLGGPGRKASDRWGVTVDPDAFLPRGLYAEYVRSVLESARAAGVAGAALEWIRDRADAVEPRGAGVAVRLEGGRSIEASGVVLALGNAPPAHPTEAGDPFFHSDRYVRDPWSERALRGVGTDSSVFIAGTGLTMVDVAVALVRAGHRGTIIAASRRGLLPHEHRAAPAAPDFLDPERSPGAIRALLRATRERVRRAASEGTDWRSILDTLRPRVSHLWLALPTVERRRFLRHVRPYWDIHRHRAAPANMRDIERMRAAGQLVVRAGRIRAFREVGSTVEVSLEPRGGRRMETVRAERVINATGPAMDYRTIGSPLVDLLLRNGMARAGPFGYGLDASERGALLDSSGAPSDYLFTIGPPLRGVLWETTAVPEIREQASALAARLLARGHDEPQD
jgi:uncharacterized NAD(P)/FAD-binding protein YdhS